jgi:hypothetical protein
MTFHRPVFAQGLFGSANRVVANQWTNGSEMAVHNAQGIQWASSQLVRPQIISQLPASVLSATSIGANRWKYSIELWVPDNRFGGTSITPASDDRITVSDTFNIREDFNTAAVVDSVPINGFTIGPVGSAWTGTTWTLAALNAHVVVTCVYDVGGNMFAFFDRPNPYVCNESSFT